MYIPKDKQTNSDHQPFAKQKWAVVAACVILIALGIIGAGYAFLGHQGFIPVRFITPIVAGPIGGVLIALGVIGQITFHYMRYKARPQPSTITDSLSDSSTQKGSPPPTVQAPIPPAIPPSVVPPSSSSVPPSPTVISQPLVPCTNKEWKEKIEGLQKPVHFESLQEAFEGVRNELKGLTQKWGRVEILDQKDHIWLTSNGQKRCTWRLPTELFAASQECSFGGGFKISGEEINHQLRSVRVGYCNEVGLTEDKMHGMLTRGYNHQDMDAQEQMRLGLYRCVSSEAYFVRNSLGKSVDREIGQPYTPTRIVTTNAPIRAGQTNDAAYWDVMEVLLDRYFQEARETGCDYVIIPGFGMGVFNSGSDKEKAYPLFATLLKKVISEHHEHFKGIIFADPNKMLFEPVQTEFNKASNFKDKLTATDKSCIDVAILFSKHQSKAALLNPGDPSCIPGQFWESGHIALEEMIALTSTMILTQHPRFNPRVGLKGNYRNMELKRPPISTSEPSSTVAAQRRKFIEQQSGIQSTQISSAVTSKIPKKELSKRGVAYFRSEEIRMKVYDPAQKMGYRLGLGCIIASMIPGEIIINENREFTNIPTIIFENGAMAIYFRNLSFAKSIAGIFKNQGITSELKMSFFTNAFGVYTGKLTIKDPESIGRLIYKIGGQGQKTIEFFQWQGEITQDQAVKFCRGIDIARNEEPIEMIPWDKTEVSGRFILPPKIFAPGVSQMVGAMSSLIVPGINTLLNAKTLQNICYVEWNEKDFRLYFSSSKAAELTGKALSRVFTDTTWFPTGKITDYGNYKGQVVFTNAKETHLYLRQICQLSPGDVLDMLNNLDPKIKEGEFVKTIIKQNKLLLEGETLEMFGSATKFIPEEEIDLKEYIFNFERMEGQSSLPSLPPEAEKIKLEELTKLFREFYKDIPQELLKNDEGVQLTQPQCEKNLEQMLCVLTGVLPNYSGLPKNEDEKQFFRSYHQMVLRHVIYMIQLLQKQKNFEDYKNYVCFVLANLAVGGSHCATRYSQELSLAYQSLAAHQSLPLYAESGFSMPDEMTCLPMVDLEAFRSLHSILTKVRTDVFNTLCEQIFSRCPPPADKSHVRLNVLKLIGKERGIPGYEGAQYRDIYQIMGGNFTKEQLLKEFDEIFSVQATIPALSHRFNGLKPGQKHTAQVMDCYKHHSANCEQYAEELFGEIDWANTPNEVPIKEKPLTQILIHLDFLKKK